MFEHIGAAAMLVNLLGAERAASLLNKDLTDPSTYDIRTLMDVYKISEAEAQSIKTAGELPQTNALQKKQLLGEALLKNAGYTWGYNDSTNKNMWFGGSMDGITLADTERVKGYINVNSNTFEKFVVNAIVLRELKSWDTTFMSENLVGSATLSKYNRGLDYIFYEKYDLDNERQDYYLSKQVQTIDVYDYKKELNSKNNEWVISETYRNQPMNIAGRQQQGNTVMSDFSLTIDHLENNESWSMTIHNAWTLDNDWIASNGKDDDPGGAWRVHDSKALTSDGCFIYDAESLDKLQNRLKWWGMHANQQISGKIYGNLGIYYSTSNP